MSRFTRSPRFVALQRKQLDAKLARIDLMPTPPEGWIRAVRSVIGMSARQLGNRMNMTPQGAADLERRERDGSITVAKLSEVAAALDCEVRVVLVPRTSLEKTVRNQAQAKAAVSRNKQPDVWATMLLRQLWD